MNGGCISNQIDQDDHANQEMEDVRQHHQPERQSQDAQKQDLTQLQHAKEELAVAQSNNPEEAKLESQAQALKGEQ